MSKIFTLRDRQKERCLTCACFIFFAQATEKEHQVYFLMKRSSPTSQTNGTSSKSSKLELIPCEIESCQRIPATLCNHCQKRVCRLHFDEHADQMVQELDPLADSINKLHEKVSAFRVKEYQQKELDKLVQWRDEAIQKINDLYELKKQKLALLVLDNEEVFLQQTTCLLEATNKLTKETAAFVEVADVTFEQLHILKRQLHVLEDLRRCNTHSPRLL